MKKLLIITAILSVIGASSYAGELYISPSILASEISSSLKRGNASEVVGEEVRTSDRTEADTSVVNIGLEGGYRFEIGNFFIGPELYFYNYGASITDYQNTADSSLSDEDEIRVEHTYGLALNLGYKFTQKFALYSRLGFGIAKYEVDWYRGLDGTTVLKDYDTKASTVMISIGGWYDLTKNMALKISYDEHNFSTQDVLTAIPLAGFGLQEDYFDITMRSINMGVIFKF